MMKIQAVRLSADGAVTYWPEAGTCGLDGTEHVDKWQGFPCQCDDCVELATRELQDAWSDDDWDWGGDEYYHE
jgi:hypothetical protein